MAEWKPFPSNHVLLTQTEAEFLDEILTKALRVFLLAIRSHLYSFALRFPFLQTHATSYTFYSYPLPYGLRHPYRNLKSKNSQIIKRNLNEIVLREFGFRNFRPH